MPATFLTNPASTLTLLLIFVGLIGTVVPALPGPPLIWLGILVWAYGDKFQHVDWITLIVLGVIALIATFADLWLTPLTQKQAGYGWKTIAAAVVGGIAGGILLSEIPIIGTLFGAVIGSLVGVSGLTFWQQRNLGAAMRAGQSYLKGCALSAFVQIVLSLVMLAIFVWRAFFF